MRDEAMTTTPNDHSASETTAAAPFEEGRTARKRRAILEAATEVFLEHGYLGASMDAVAARAAVSKQTVYKQFADKDNLFTEVVLGTTVQVAGGLTAAATTTIDDADDVKASLGALARGFLSGLLRPEVVRLRRLIIAEADRFPEIGQHVVGARLRHVAPRARGVAAAARRARPCCASSTTPSSPPSSSPGS